MMKPEGLRTVLLDLIGTAATPDLALLGADEWTVLDSMAAQHRLQPLLHVQHGRNCAIPGHVQRTWAEAFRFQAILALRQQADLHATVQLLDQHGYRSLALKGAWLSRFAFPQPAMRPMRDIDLLLDEDTVIPAYEVLQAAGYRTAEPAEVSLAEAIRLEKHLPPLITPGGTCVELHHRLWEPDGRMDHASPREIDAAVRAAAITEADGISYPAPIDMLAHLIAHAIYSHRLDCGPLLLADIDFLLCNRSVDWSTFWVRANREGWRDGARLVLELVVAHRSGVTVDFSADQGPPVPPHILKRAPQLLLQDLTVRKSAGVLASIRTQGAQGLYNRLLGRRRVSGTASVQREMDSEGGFFGWMTKRLRRTASDLSNPEVRHQAEAMADLSQWLDQTR